LSAAPANFSPITADVLSVRREVTVLFLDMTDFTSASHTLDSEDVFVWIDETMRLLVAVVEKYEGTIDKFTGDGLMALFGAPLAHENDPELAVRAALEMQTVVQPLRERIKQKHGFDFRMRIGINTGPVVAGQVGAGAHAEYTVLGDTVNLAARLEKAAEPGTILVSDSTYQRTQPLFAYTALPPINVKGMPDPIQSFRPLRLLERPGSVRGIPGLQASLIGRAHMLARLHAALDKVCALRHSEIVLVTGEAGLGKSRLVAEFRKTVRRSEVCVYQGACLAYARSTPLWLVADILRGMLHVSEIDPPNIQRETLRAYISQIGGVEQDLLPYLSNVLGLEPIDPDAEARLRQIDAAMLQRQTHAALRQIFLAESSRAPTVLVFDDLHWVDPASRDFLEYLIQTAGDAPLLLVLVSRDSERQTVVRPLISAAEKMLDRLTDIQLQALSDSESEALVDQLIHLDAGDSQALKNRIAMRAAGNPFYTEEIIRFLIDHGGLVADGSGWCGAPHADALLEDVPGTLKGLILTRFDRLPDELRRTLQRAAVLGRSFPASLLQILGGATPPTIAAQFAELQSRQFLVTEPFGWAQGYAFRHVLIQEAVYGTLLKRDRQQLHEQIAQLIERAAFWPPDEQTEVLAYHYAEGVNPVRAVPYLIDAAENAARRYANETAIRHYRRALALMQGAARYERNDFFRVRAGLGEALKFVGQFAEAGQVLEEAYRQVDAAALGSPTQLPMRIRILRELADVRHREGAQEEAIAYLEAGLAALESAGDSEQGPLRRALLDRKAWIRFRQGDLEEALSLASAAIGGVRPEYAEDPITLASLFNTMGGVFWQQGKLEEAIVYVEHSLELYKGLGYSWGTANGYTNLGVLHYARGNWPAAAACFEQADALRRENGYMPERATNLKNLGVLSIAMGEHDRAQQHLETSLNISHQLADDYGVAGAEIGLLLLAVIQGRLDEAIAHAEQARRHLPTASDDQATQLHWLLALVHAESGDLQQGLTLAAQALRMARSEGGSEQEPECLRVLGALRARGGDYLQAEALLREAIDLCQQRNDPYRQALALIELGRLYEHLRELGRSVRSEQDALTAYCDAAELFARLGATYDLAMAQSARDRLKGGTGQRVDGISLKGQRLLSLRHLPETERAMIMS